VNLFSGQSPQRFDNLVFGDFRRLLKSLVLGQLRGNGRRSNGSHAAQGLEPDVLDVFFSLFILSHLDVNLHQVPADRIAHHSHSVGILDFPPVLGLEKLV